ncbi:MAG: choline-sulfatase [Verrucomicrobiales bacterium]
MAKHTVAAIFIEAVYDTMRTCKKGNSYEGANEKFTVRHDAGKRGGSDETGSAWHAEQVLDYLGDCETSKDEDPFMIYFGFSHPHDARDGKPELLEKYGAVNHTDKDSLPPANPKQPLLPSNYLPAHPFPRGHPGLRDERTIRNELGREFACSENIDIQCGRVLEKLKALGQLDNTYIFHTSDHGMAIGRHGLQGKQNLYEHSWRVPFIAMGPGIESGSRALGNIYLLGVLAALCDFADIEAPSTNEGLSFRTALEGKESSIRDVLYGVYSGGTKPGMRCVKQGDWKLIKYDVLDETVRKTQLFNLSENPHEFLVEHQASDVISLTKHTPKPNQRNLADDPAHSEKRRALEALPLSEQERLHDPYRLWDQ